MVKSIRQIFVTTSAPFQSPLNTFLSGAGTYAQKRILLSKSVLGWKLPQIQPINTKTPAHRLEPKAGVQKHMETILYDSITLRKPQS